MSIHVGVNDANSNAKTHHPSINIIGAGIAGLSLACQLRRRRIPFTIFDAATKPKGHQYGITISTWGYADLLVALEPKLSQKTFRELTAVDRLIGGQGIATSSSRDMDDLRASDMPLREILARGHQVKWNHKVVSAESVADGLKLRFENGVDSTANITIDAGGERSGLSSLLLPDLKPEILPYAVYHGTRYIPQSTFDARHHDVFEGSENVKCFPPTSSSQSPAWHLQVAKSYVTKDHLPSKVSLDVDSNEPIVEFRYTFSRPARTKSESSSSPSSDLLFRPSRAPNEATQIPSQFHAEVSAYLSNTPLPSSLRKLLDPSSLQQDRILNWLLRLKPIQQDRLETLASKHVVAIGDATHSTPPVGSQGASYAMADAAKVAAWIEESCSGSEASEEKMSQFYADRIGAWQKITDETRAKLREMHELDTGTSRQIEMVKSSP